MHSSRHCLTHPCTHASCTHASCTHAPCTHAPMQSRPACAFALQVAARYMEEYTAGCFRLRAQFSTERQIMAIKVCGVWGGGDCSWTTLRVTLTVPYRCGRVTPWSSSLPPFPPAGAGGQPPVAGGGDGAHARRSDEDATQRGAAQGGDGPGQLLPQVHVGGGSRAALRRGRGSEGGGGRGGGRGGGL